MYELQMLAKRVGALLGMQYLSLNHLFAYAVACSRVESHVSNTCGSITQPMSSDCPRSASVLICRFTVLADRNPNTNFNIRERARDFSKDSLYTTYPPPKLRLAAPRTSCYRHHVHRQPRETIGEHDGRWERERQPGTSQPSDLSASLLA
jgi:hypothetical protein